MSTAVLAGLCATLLGIGLARFAYTPLIPALVAEGWFAPSTAVYLGAANLAGYLAGAALARGLAARAGAPRVLRAMMATAAASLLACAVPLSFAWFFVWRLASGVAGGALMVLAAPTVLPHVDPARRGLASGLIFTGVGLGIAASGTLVPLLMRVGLAETWGALGALGVVLTAVAWRGWPPAPVAAAAARAAPPRRPTGPLAVLLVEYALNAAGLVPHMVFLVDFVARGLGQGLDVGARYWVLFGLGATVGPVTAGLLADRIGFRPALRLAFVVQATAVAALAWASGPVALLVSSVVIGAAVPGVVPLVLGRVQELIPGPGPRRDAAWGAATTAFALGQAVAAYGFSFLFARAGRHAPLFALGALALLAALVLDLVSARHAGPRRRAGYAPVKRGGRLARKAATPSRKSALP